MGKITKQKKQKNQRSIKKETYSLSLFVLLIPFISSRPTDPYTKYPGIPEFNATVNALVDAGNRGKSIYTVTKMYALLFLFSSPFSIILPSFLSPFLLLLPYE